MANIRISPEEVEVKSQQVGQESQELQELINKSNTIIASLNDVWEGNAAESFANQWQECLPGLQQAQELLETLQGQLAQTAQIYRDADQEIANQFGVN